jgi:hypothetical protein
MSTSVEHFPVILDPDIRTPTDYAEAEPLKELEAEPSQQEIEEVFSLADAARAVGAWSGEEN